MKIKKIARKFNSAHPLRKVQGQLTKWLSKDGQDCQCDTCRLKRVALKIIRMEMND